jgi:phage/plasmid-associated DNA primase
MSNLSKIINAFLSDADAADLFTSMNKTIIKIVSIDEELGYFYDEEKGYYTQLLANKFIHILRDFFNDMIEDEIKLLNNELKETIKKLEDFSKVEELKKQNKNNVDALVKCKAKSGKIAFQKQVMKWIYNKYYDAEFIKMLNGKVDELPIKNKKVICLRTGNTRDRTPSDLFDYELDVEKVDKYDFIDKVMLDISTGNENKKTYLQNAFGYALTGETNAKCFFFLYGPSADNGKSVLFNITSDILSQISCTIPTNLIIDNNTKPEQLQLDFGSVINKRFGTISEVEGKLNMENSIKKITGTDKTFHRLLYTNSFYHQSILKIFIAGNKSLFFDTHENGSINRFRMILLNSKFTTNPNPKNKNEYPMDTNLVNKIKTTYRNELFSWMLQGAIRYFNANCKIDFLKITDPEMKKQQEMYLDKIDNIGSFIKTRCVQNKKDYIAKTCLYDAFINDLDYKVNMSNKQFYTKILAMNFLEVKHNGIDSFKGLRLKTPEELLTNEITEEPDEDKTEIKKLNDTITKLNQEIAELKKQLEIKNNSKNQVIEKNETDNDTDDDWNEDDYEEEEVKEKPLDYTTIKFGKLNKSVIIDSEPESETDEEQPKPKPKAKAKAKPQPKQKQQMKLTFKEKKDKIKVEEIKAIDKTENEIQEMTKIFF